MQVPGLYYVPNYLSTEEQELLTQELLKSTWNMSLSRRTLHYGYNYSYSNKGLTKIADIPELYKNLISKDRINNAIKIDLLKDENFDQLIINEYVSNQGIAKHIDKVNIFGPIIICISLGCSTNITFRKDNNTFVQFVEPNSLYIMSGDARYTYTHEIKKQVQKGIRYSLTFRTVI